MEIGLFRDIQNDVSRHQSELFQFRKKRYTRGTKLFNISSTSKIDLGPPCRLNGQPSAFFLCHKKPHKPASKSTLARWIKDVLLLADVDTKVFKAHSLRGASSSKALLKGLSVKEVVDHGRWSLEST